MTVARIVLGAAALLAAAVAPPASAELARGGYGASAVGGFGAGIRITEGDCRELVGHTPDADVAYRPGVDAEGRPVAPADAGGGAQLVLPRDQIIELELDLEDRLDVPAGTYSGAVSMGLVEVRDGRAYYNGQPLTHPDQAALEDACDEARTKR
ncbi:MAG: hypothetical protein HQL38_00170 [Alphaproteobacteria bacterium]|nr:hypothetical protein [Alphaproteobacteria bacterium]